MMECAIADKHTHTHIYIHVYVYMYITCIIVFICSKLNEVFG